MKIIKDFVNKIYKQIQSRKPKLHEFLPKERGRGNDFSLMRKLDDKGHLWSICIFSSSKISKNDVIGLGIDYDKMPYYQIVNIERTNVEDQIFVIAKWLPRIKVNKYFPNKAMEA
jgi:hypothetical protein